MKKIILLLLMCLVTTASAKPAPDFPREAFIAAIFEVEGAGPGVVGPKGERGRGQLMPANHRRYRGNDLARAHAHLEDLIAECQRRGVPVLPYNLALFWNAGGPVASSGRAPVSSYHYANRVVNILNSR